MAKKLTDRLVLKLATPKGGPRVVWDTLATGFGIKITPAGRRLFVLQTKFPGHAVQTTRTLGAYPGMTLADARAKAQRWYGLARAGIDPSVEEQKERDALERAAMLAQERSFAAVAEAYIARVLPKQRRGARVERQIRKELIPHWGARPVAEIGRQDVVALVERVASRATTGSYARNILQVVTVMFNWAIERGVYGLEHSPCDRIKPSKLIGKKQIRTRVLSDDEIRRLWAATGEVGYPFGPLIRMLLFTGCRLNEVAGARWREVDGRTWIIPRERFKSDSEHIVPLSDDMMALLETLPRGQRADFIFSVTGLRPASGGPLTKAKARIDKLMGDAPPWVIHDLRRTVRTRLSQLRVPEHVAEAVIGHGKKGLARIYNQHELRDKIREALDAWAMLLRSIVEPSAPADKVVMLPRRA